MRDNRILVVSDDFQFYNLIQNAVQESGIGVCQIATAFGAQNYFSQCTYCLTIVDIPYLSINALDMIRMIRQSQSMPILVLTEKIAPKDKIVLFHAGANACLEVPVDLSLCVAQANSLVHLYIEALEKNWEHKPLRFGNELIIDPTYRQVIIDGEPLPLTRKEFDLLLCLARHPGQVWSRTQLYNQVWSDNPGISGENAVRVHIGNLRKKLSGMGKMYIQTSWDIGYSFVPPTEGEKKKLL